MNPPMKVNKSSSESKILCGKNGKSENAITCNHKKGIDPKNPTSKLSLEKFEVFIDKKKIKR